MSARPGGYGGAGGRAAGGGGSGTQPSGRPGGFGEDVLADENGVTLTDENAVTLTIPDGVFGTPTQTGGANGGGTARPRQ